MVRKRDQFWEYVQRLDGKFKCKFCDRKFAGGVPRVKSHLSGIKGSGIDICTKVPEDVRVAATEAIFGPNKRAKAEASPVKIEGTSLKTHTNKDEVLLDKLLVKFILLNDIDVDIVRRPSFIDFVNAMIDHGSHYKLPCCSLVKTKLVPDLENVIGEHVANVKKSWVKTGCTLIYDSWSDKERSFIYIFAYSIEGAILLNALEIKNDESTNARFLYPLVEKDRILKSSPWSYSSNLLVLKQCDPEIPEHCYDFSKASFWVRIGESPWAVDKIGSYGPWLKAEVSDHSPYWETFYGKIEEDIIVEETIPVEHSPSSEKALIIREKGPEMCLEACSKKRAESSVEPERMELPVTNQKVNKDYGKQIISSDNLTQTPLKIGKSSKKNMKVQKAKK
ncbi:uncharacterized protein LOC104445137 [Eucalyptus grandis]|uniref:uncharacterized protein LOC104445137 n=1 Tax=Eucalyptus grandis TaxID=71139 RepID=UPI00192EF8B7|nr:uncharacterized protein LOC104445137 [Eucalyptus grandis]